MVETGGFLLVIRIIAVKDFITKVLKELLKICSDHKLISISHVGKCD